MVHTRAQGHVARWRPCPGECKMRKLSPLGPALLPLQGQPCRDIWRLQGEHLLDHDTGSSCKRKPRLFPEFDKLSTKIIQRREL